MDTNLTKTNNKAKVTVQLDMAALKMQVNVCAIQSMAWAEIYIDPRTLELPPEQFAERYVTPAVYAVIDKWKQLEAGKAQIK